MRISISSVNRKLVKIEKTNPIIYYRHRKENRQYWNFFFFTFLRFLINQRTPSFHITYHKLITKIFSFLKIPFLKKGYKTKFRFTRVHDILNFASFCLSFFFDTVFNFSISIEVTGFKTSQSAAWQSVTRWMTE